MTNQNSEFRIQNFIALFCLLSFALVAACGVSVPNLESPVCTEARDAVKKFYSYHFDAGAALTPESISAREKFLSPQFYSELQNAVPGRDPFTLTAEFPRTFRLAACEPAGEVKTVTKVLLFWKDDETSSQRAVRVEAVKQNEIWLINNISEE